MKNITFEFTERVIAWYRASVCVTEEDVRRYILSEMQDAQESSYLNQKQRDTIVAHYQKMLEEFVDDEEHESWYDAAVNKFERPDVPIETESDDIEGEQLESDGWDGEEEASENDR